MLTATMQEMVLAYLTQSYEQLGTDGFLVEQDVTFPQATDLLNDFVIFVHAFCEGKAIGTDVDESVEEQITDLLKEHLDDINRIDNEIEEEGDYAAHEYRV